MGIFKTFRIHLITIFLFFSLWGCNKVEKSEKLKLWYNQPAEKWVEALPIGNGRLGAMVFGGVKEEHIQFNEETLWTGAPHDYSHKGAYKYLEKIRQLLKDGKQDEAEKLAMEEFMSIPIRQENYQPFGDIWINFPGHENFTNYYRDLDLLNAQVNVDYSVNGINFKRTYFASQPDQVVVSRFEANKGNSISFTLKVSAEHKSNHIEILDDNTILFEVKVENGVLEGSSLIKVQQVGGIIKTEGDNLIVENADNATIYLTASTTFISPKEVGGKPYEKNQLVFKNLLEKNYKETLKEHLNEYQSYFNRFSIDFGNHQNDTLPTDLRIIRSMESFDASLAALYVQYARYLLISSSRPGTYPANLQGIWNKDINPAWGSKYTTNINAEMNYWPAEILNLSECAIPLFKMIDELVEPGRVTAREHYNCDGWVEHHNTDLWRGTAPINHSNHGIWPSGGAWLCHHLWEHFLYTKDTLFLKKSFPILKEAALFFTEFLVKDEKTGWLISTPSNSPENGGLVAGPTMDHAIIKSLFKITIEASEIIKEKADFANKLKDLIPQIAPYQIGHLGQLQEWLEDKDDPENKHRHVSHLWAIYPGKEINWRDTPDLMDAAKQSLFFRGDEGTGWSLAWKINYWARFKDGNHALNMVNMLLGPAEYPERKIRGGSYPNLFDAHPPFQIDGNFGGAAGIIEMLLQSHSDEIELLPALPDLLPKGEIKGVKARGGFELDYLWDEGKLGKVKIRSNAGGKLKIRYHDIVKEFDTQKKELIELNNLLEKI